MATLVLLATFRAHRERSLAPSTTLSAAGWEVLSEQGRLLDARLRGKATSEYSAEEVAWYVALKPLPHLRLPGLDHHFVPLLGDANPTGQAVELGRVLSEEESAAAQRTNSFRKTLLGVGGLLALLVGLASLRFATGSFILWANVGVVAVVALRVGIGAFLINRWDSHLRESGTFLPKGEK
ncbi:MAG: hypothetical protein ACE37F_01695 [Nannocystaceae bacterium]|nr:hypothetical protein [bacterium]